jgi:hypothetical protein
MEVTLFITSCGRPHLLKQTLESFMRFNTYPIKEAIICEDSGNINSIDFAKNILNFPCNIIYNEKRIGQMRSIENGVKYITTPYVFHCEDDWEFYGPGFIEISMQILESNNKISQVYLRSYDDYLDMYSMKIDNNINTLYNIITLNDGNATYSFNPSLKKKEIELLNIPYKKIDEEEKEGTIQKKIQEMGYNAVVTKNITGFVKHIGWNEHIY